MTSPSQRPYTRPGAVLLVAVIGLVVCRPVAADDRLIAAGRTFAVEACSACHRAASSQGDPPAVLNPDQNGSIRAPSFREIARDPRKDAIYLRAFIRAPHYPMREQAIAEPDLDAVVAYLMSLRSARRGKSIPPAPPANR